ncbi:MAG: isoleucine--tRNA ligase [Candidatus Omnitrophota bacterium]|nr:isoleucine--tRNA ligase [Candidatus Omnitrophota bacterium]MBU3929758.1 isoleucine--tRNA ligase [bacterium]MBU4123218.1 isoleucine--tRNA ligase [bacterium]
MSKYKVLLPKTAFSMKANLREKEPLIQQKWKKADIYEQILLNNAGKKVFVLHDGPPYANGRIHIGHALNKILKDIIVKYKNISGFAAPFVPGWDCHGLPIEYQLFKELNIGKSDISQIEFRKKAADFAKNFVKIQMKEFMRLGIFADWGKPYLTINKTYEAGILETFAELVEKGYVYRGAKPVYWCCDCETALAEAEVEYHDIPSPSITVLFKSEELENTCAAVWTTTPWTLPANVALAFNKDFLYSVIELERDGKKIRVLALDEKKEEIRAKFNSKDMRIISQAKGIKYAGMKFRHPFLERSSVGIVADFVESGEGTGIVHIAPGHGEDDYRAGLKYNLPVISPVDERGRFTEEAGEFSGQFVLDANEKILDVMRAKGSLLESEQISHSYPHCWRCKKPVIFRATPQWFISIDKNNLRGKLLEEIKGVGWTPPEGEKRISAMVEGRPDWCISRQRYWGVPIPVFYCEKCGEHLLDSKVIKKLAALVRAEGSDILLKENLPLEMICEKCGGKKFSLENDILDVWFDSGASNHILEERAGHHWPADLYLEGSDQHRGWFQSSLILSCAAKGAAPYKNVVTHGFVTDGEGRKMSKSQGNVITPQEIIDKSGADILRIWTASQNYAGDLRLSDEILKSCTDYYRKIRNTFRFMLGNLHGWTSDMQTPKDRMTSIDLYILSRMETVKKEVRGDYESYNIAGAFHRLFDFINLDLSSFYLDIIKDRLYTLGEDWPERRSSQSALWELLKNLTLLFAPVLAHTSEEVLQTAKEEIDGSLPDSVFLTEIPEEKFVITAKKAEEWAQLFKIRESVLKAIEKARGDGRIGNALEAGVSISGDGGNAIAAFSETELKEIFLISQIGDEDGKEILAERSENGVTVKIYRADGVKCGRCWRITRDNSDGLCGRCGKIEK